MKGIHKKIAKAVREGKDPLSLLTAAEMRQFSGHARSTASAAKEKEAKIHKRLVRGLEVAISETVAKYISEVDEVKKLLPGGLKVYVDKRGKASVQFSRRLQTHTKPAEPLSQAALAYAMFLRQLAYDAGSARVSLTPIIDALREDLGYTWPGKNAKAQRDSLKNAMARAPEDVTVVVDLRDPKAIRQWGRKDEDRKPAAAAMIAAMRGEA